MIINIVLLVLLLLFFMVGFSWVIASRIMKKPRELIAYDWDKQGADYEHISFFSSDGLKLAGVFLHGTNSHTIILLHGYGRSKEQMIPHALFLNRAGYNILIFDFRASGQSEGSFITFGSKEQADLEGAVQYLKNRKDIDAERIGVLGFSMGGAVALMKSGDLPEIKAIVINSTYARFKTVIWNNFQRYFKGLPFFPMGYFVLWVIKLRTGIYYPRINPVTYIDRLQARPLMIIHGAHDKRIPLADAVEFHRSAPWLKEFWLVRDADHENTYTINEANYEKNVIQFFKNYLIAGTS